MKGQAPMSAKFAILADYNPPECPDAPAYLNSGQANRPNRPSECVQHNRILGGINAQGNDQAIVQAGRTRDGFH